MDLRFISRILPYAIPLLVGCRAETHAHDAGVVRLSAGTNCGQRVGRLINQHAELPDGRLAVIDVDAPAVLLIDCAAHRVDTLGRKGGGPGEYVRPEALAATDAGGLALLDPGNARVTVWDSSLKLDTTRAVPQQFLNYQVALDSRTNVYFMDPPATSPEFMGPGDRAGRVADSALVYRVRADAYSKVDTVASVVIAAADWIGHVAKFPRRFDTQDAWGTLPSGTFWIARARENRLDRIDSTGHLLVGTPRTWVPVPTTAGDARMMRNIAGPPPDSIPWPTAKVKAPFDEAVASADGEVWVRMLHPAGFAEQDYAVFGADAKPVARRVALPVGDRILHVGRTALWVASQDADGFTTLTQFMRPHVR